MSPDVIAVVRVDPGAFLIVVSAAAVAAGLVAALAPHFPVPVVVVELLLGVLIGPHGLGLVADDAFISFFAGLGLGLLFFFAGYEIDFDRIRGDPLRLAARGWALSLVLAYALAGVLESAGIIVSFLYVGSAMATTALGTLLPVVTDAGELHTRFGTYLLAAGAVGELGPVLLFTLVLSGTQPLHEALLLVAFVALAVIAALVAVRALPAGWAVLERSLESSTQLAVRLTVVLVFALLALAGSLGLDVLLGGFAAGVIVRLALRGREVTVLESKLSAIGFGFLIPFFFIVSGVRFDLAALTASPSAALKLPLFFAAFLLVRGAPALLLYRGVLDRPDRHGLALLSSVQLPLVVAITTVALDDGDMRSSTAAALVGAALLSTLAFPILGMRARSPAPAPALH